MTGRKEENAPQRSVGGQNGIQSRRHSMARCSKETMKERIRGALYGVAIGDAMGAPLEFMSAVAIRKKYGTVTEMIGGGWMNVDPGEVTDDTQMSLAAAEGIMESPEDPVPAVGRRFIKWAESGPKDIGGTCSVAIETARAYGSSPTAEQWRKAAEYTAKMNGGRTGGNGALMRDVYPGIYYQKTTEAVNAARDIAEMTHHDKESTAACMTYAAYMHEATEIEKAAKSWIRDGLRLINIKYVDLTADPTGYVVDSLKCALLAFRDGKNFEETIILAVNRGGDADTIGAIAGGLAGVYYGCAGIPKRWITALSKETRERIERAADAAFMNRTKEED